MLVAEKKNVNFNLPPEIHAQFERIVEGVGGKQKWVAISAAVLMLIEADAEVRRHYLQSVVAAEVDNSFEELIERARSGDLRWESDHRPKRTLPRAAAKSKRGEPK
jgi:hypothetical protein